jgi:hypothetical protein
MSERNPLADIFYIPYPAIDAAVGEQLSTMILNNSMGEQVELSIRWRALSAGSSEHLVLSAPFNTFIVRVTVQQLPEEKKIATRVTYQADRPDIIAILPAWIKQLQTVVKYHQNALTDLEEKGTYTPPVFTDTEASELEEPPMPPKPTNEEEWHASFDWFDQYRSQDPDDAMAQAYNYQKRTVQQKRSDLGRSRFPQKSRRKSKIT